MDRFLGKYSAYLYALLRIIAGLLFLMHGSQKLLDWPPRPAPPPQPAAAASDNNKPQPPPAWVMPTAGVIELVGGIMILLGLFTSYVAFIASGEMAVAYFMNHAGKALWPIQNGGELAVLYCFLFLYMASVGSGALSLDALFKRRS
jgi:putative oxidoreductase